jgi:hypothetical protein
MEGELLYFDARGAGETTRLLFAAAGASASLTDVRWDGTSTQTLAIILSPQRSCPLPTTAHSTPPTSR